MHITTATMATTITTTTVKNNKNLNKKNRFLFCFVLFYCRSMHTHISNKKNQQKNEINTYK